MVDSPPSPGSGMRTQVLPADDRGIARAAEALRNGELVAFPTETVYGLGADAASSSAVKAVYEAKGRPAGDPLIVHVSDLQVAGSLGDMDAAGGNARRLAEAFWPGPLTIVVPRIGGVAPEVALGETIALRCPAHPVALALIAATGLPIAAPSANRFGRVSPTDAHHVMDELDGRIGWVLDGGATPLGIESTVVAADETGVRVLRPGGVPVEDLTHEMGEGVVETPAPVLLDTSAVAPAPGMGVSHYVPSVPLVLTDAGVEVAEEIAEALRRRGLRATVLRLPQGDLGAADLYSRLRGLDPDTADVTVTSTVDPAGLGRAVNDRLFRASRGHVVVDALPASIDRVSERLRS